MIESRVNKKYNIWVMISLAIMSILATFYSIWTGYAEYFAGSAADVMVAIFQILLFDGIVAVAISYIWSTFMHITMSRSMAKLAISRFDFCFYYMFFIAISRLAIAIVGAFQFLVPAMAVFCTYLSSMVFSTASMAVYFFLVLKRAYIKQGLWAKAFVGFATPYLIVQVIAYLLSAMLFANRGYFEPILSEIGYTVFYDANELYAVIAGAVVLALYLGGAVGAFFWLKQKDKDALPQPGVTITVEKEEKVFEEFDI